MQPTQILLKRPVQVLQVFRNACMYQKDQRPFTSRKDGLCWTEKASSSGYVHNGALYLPEKSGGYEDINRFTLVLLLDDLSEDRERAAWKQTPNSYAQPASLTGLLFLQIKLTDTIALHLNGSKYEWWPERANYKLCELKIGQPVEVKINGKSDGYHQRYYQEERLLFEYLGDFNSFKVLPAAHQPVVKPLPAERKVVDLRVLLW